jgi:putative transposon-encoded protein
MEEKYLGCKNNDPPNKERWEVSRYNKNQKVSMNSMQVTLEAYDSREKTVKDSRSSGSVYLPKEWIGKKVKVFLIEPLED